MMLQIYTHFPKLQQRSDNFRLFHKICTTLPGGMLTTTSRHPRLFTRHPRLDRGSSYIKAALVLFRPQADRQ